MRRRVSVYALILIAAVIAAVVTRKNNAEREAQRAREAELRATLGVMRHAIAGYRKKHAAAPPSLEALVSDGELRAVPVDAITRSAATWRTTLIEQVRVDDFQPAGTPPKAAVFDVHSGANGCDASGRRFADY